MFQPAALHIWYRSVKPREGFFNAVTIKANMVKTARAHRRPTRFVAQIGILRRRPASGCNMHDILITDIKPVHGNAEIWRIPYPQAQRIPPPIPRCDGVVRENEGVFEKLRRHGLVSASFWWI